MKTPLTQPGAMAPRRSIEYHLRHTTGKAPAATLTAWRMAVSRAIRDLVIAPWIETTQRVHAEDPKRVYHLSDASSLSVACLRMPSAIWARRTAPDDRWGLCRRLPGTAL